MKNVVCKIVILAIAATFFTGCDQSSNKYVNELKNYKQPPDTDVTRSPKYNFSSFSGTVWKTKVKTALMDIALYTGKRIICLSPPDVFDSADPHYAPVSGARMVSMLPVGTYVHIERLMRDNGIGDQLWVIARVGNGTIVQNNIYVGRHFLANNKFIPTGPTSSTNWGVNPDMLEAVTNMP